MIQIKLPNSTEDRLRNAWGEQLDQVALHGLIIESYRAGRISVGEVGELLDLDTSLAAQTWLADKGVPVNYDDANLEEDRRTLERHFAGFKA